MTKPHPDTAKYYSPINKKDRYPLELDTATVFKGSKQDLYNSIRDAIDCKTFTGWSKSTDVFHINLWSEDGKYKWAIASVEMCKEGYPELHFIGDRPLNSRVDWKHFKELTEQAYNILDDINNERRRAEEGVFQ
ncbi:MAG: hypothetical protein EBU90_29980 [Proteobacteria bacterium]|nr:hypothetical protein [Pseudomonadota bacterium]